MKQIIAILLAAGSSSRLGRSKQMLKIKGKSLLKHATETAIQSKLSHVIVVLGSEAALHSKEIQNLDTTILTNHDWEKGVGNTIKFGLGHIIKNHSKVSGVLIMVCDQPAINAGLLDEIIETFLQSGKKIIASAYRGTMGVPVLFDKSYFDLLLSIADDKGAKSIIASSPADVGSVDFPGGEMDIDTLGDYDKYV